MQSAQATGQHVQADRTAAGYALCDPGSFCSWTEPHFRGDKYSGAEPVEPNGCDDAPPGVAVQSIINNTGMTYAVGQEGSCAAPGRVFYVQVGESPTLPFPVRSVSWCRDC
ncbi:peptidase inhibitor family I36 protein [Streptomyces sp. DH18]|uniref:peptidase inhibitor family I36 protein n=1 Tax=Streptomyces sp. DH18 TaxID=3040126 RepID=UPI003FA6ECEE